MHGAIVVFLFFATVANARSQELCLNGNCTANEVQVQETIGSFRNSWHDLNEREMFGTICQTMIKGDFYRSKWRWQGRFWCSSLSEIEGYSKNQDNRDDAIERAIDDYVQKGIQLEFLTEDHLQDAYNVQLDSMSPTIDFN